jgi:CheY-like chemotaxis protein/pimeloyl-ACP methyl ester carboxylesterase
MQKFIPSRGSDRSIYRVAYARPHRCPPSIESIARHSEYLSAERADRSEFMPIASFNESINAAIETATMKALKHIEERLRVRVHKAFIDYIVDESGFPHLMYAFDILMSDAIGQTAYSDRAAVADTAGLDMSAPSSPLGTSRPGTQPMSATLDLDLAVAIAGSTIEDEFNALLGCRVGNGGKSEVLLICNDATAALTAAHALVTEGYNVTILNDGAQALATTRGVAFDCVLVARDLPSLSGLEVARILRQREMNMAKDSRMELMRLPLLILSAKVEQEDLKMYKDIGFNGCVSLPLSVEALVKTVSVACPYPMRSKSSQLSRTGAPPSRPAGSALFNTAGTASNPAQSTFSSQQITESKARETPAATMTPALIQEPTTRQRTTGGMKSPYESSVVTASSTRRGRTQQTQPRSPQQDGKTRSISPQEKSNTTLTTKPSKAVAAPVTGGPHGGRLGMGAGTQVHAGARGAKGGSGDNVILGTYRLDAETEMPYCVLGQNRSGAPYFHLIVVQDMFDTYERYQVLLQKMTQSLPGFRVLLFNYPGQAFTQFRKDVVLNNEYLAGCLQSLLVHLGAAGTREFDFDGGEAPYFVMGHGNGGSVGAAFVSQYADVYPNLRGLIFVNAFINPDAHLAGIFHDCVNVFSCTPPQRPDLPVYFFARYLFCAPYLEKIGAPLALNMYTAVANPISLDGRIALCQGALSHANVLPGLNKMEIPVIAVCSTRSSFVKPAHTQAIAKSRGGEARSIRRTLYSKRQAAVIQLPAGHEVFQECKSTMLNLLVQLVTGYHEKNDVAFVPMEEHELALLTPGADGLAASAAAGKMSKLRVKQASSAIANEMHLLGETEKGALLLEDRFLDYVVTSMRNPEILARYQANPLQGTKMLEESMEADARGIALVPTGAAEAFTPRPHLNPKLANQSVVNSLIPQAKYGNAGMMGLDMSASTKGMATGATGSSLSGTGPNIASEMRKALPPLRRMDTDEVRTVAGKLARVGAEMAIAGTDGNPLRMSQGLKGNLTGNTAAASKASEEPHPAVQEYMKWRVVRNRRRLQRIEACAIIIQRAWRQFLARTAVRRIVEHRAALDMQAFWRGCMGRAYAKEVRRIVFAVKAVQRVYRGHLVRRVARRLRAEHAAAVEIQRIWKGYTIRKYIVAMKQRFLNAAIRLQCTWRRFAALKELVKRRIERVAAVTIQRIARGFLARRKALRERERYLFSKSQAQGIEFARQLLMEHKLKATRLQSEVSTLTREKVLSEEKIHALLTEIATFEQAVRQLEKDMVQLSKIDAEVALAMDDQAKIELRENKLRLDREFSSMLDKISDRKKQLTLLENKLQSLDRSKDSKHEELKDLERKLVILLEQQQSEIQAIRQRQEMRGEHMIEDAVEAVNRAMENPDRRGGRAPPMQLEDFDRHGNRLAIMDDPVRNAIGGGSMVSHSGGRMQSSTINFEDLPGVGGRSRGGMTTAISTGPTAQQRAEAAALMASTETMMKFGFMAMSMTYFSSLNMVKSMKHLGTANTLLATNPLLSAITQAGANGMAGSQLTTAMGGTIPAQMTMGASVPNAIEAKVHVNLWTVADVGAWLDVLTLGQYKDSFAEASIDGAFLIELTEEDLQNALGVEHPLHRKKIVASILRMQKEFKEQEAFEAAKRAAATAAIASAGSPVAAAPSPLMTLRSPTRQMEALTDQSLSYTAPPLMGGPSTMSAFPTSAPTPGRAGAIGAVGSLDLRDRERKEAEALSRSIDKETGLLKLGDMISWIRHDKMKQLSDALVVLPDVGFDNRMVTTPYINNVGTEYAPALRGPAFHINKADDKGNSLLIVAAQNNRLRLAQLLLRKGANVDHQNALGNTALHYAMAYKFTDLAAWLVDPEKGGASEEVRNIHDLDPYEGLEP